MMKYQVQFNNNTMTLPSLIWLRDFLIKRKGIQHTRTIMSMVESGKVYQDAEIKVITIMEH